MLPELSDTLFSPPQWFAETGGDRVLLGAIKFDPGVAGGGGGAQLAPV